MKSYKKDELFEIIKSPERLKDEIKNSWGSIFIDFENNEVLPKKEDLLAMKDAAVLPFLFKNYFIENSELEEIKGLVSLFKNRAGWMNKDSKDSKDFNNSSVFVEEELNDLEIKNEDNFSDYSVIFNAIANNKSIPYIPEVHNISLLERLHKDGVPILFSANDYDESLNCDWMLNVILNTSVSDFENISPDFATSLIFFMKEGEYSDSYFTDLIKTPSFLNNLYKNYNYLSFYDLKKYGCVGVQEDVFYEALGKMFEEEKNNSSSPSTYLKIDLDSDLHNLLSGSFDINKIKSITENRIVAFWDKSDLLDDELRRNFLKKMIPYGSGMVYGVEKYYKLGFSDFSDVFTKEDAIDYFNSVYKSKTRDSFQLNRNLNLANLQNTKVTDQQMDILSHLVASIYPDQNALISPMDINKMVVSIFENDGWGSYVNDSQGLKRLLNKVVDLYSDNGKTAFDYMFLKDIYPLMKKHYRLFYPFSEKIESSFKSNKSVDAAVLCCREFKDYPKIYEMKDELFNNLNPHDVKALREMGFPVAQDIMGTEETPVSKNNVFSRLIKSGHNYDHDLLEIALKSSSFREKMRVEFKLDNQKSLSAWLFFSNYLTKDNKSFIVDLIESEISRDLSLVSSVNDRLFNAISNEENLKSFLPKKPKMPYKTFLSSHQMIKEMRDLAPSMKTEFTDKLQEMSNELSLISRDCLSEYTEKMIENRDWEKGDIPHALLESTIQYLMNSDLRDKDINSNDLLAIFTNLNKGYSSIYTNFLKSISPEDFNENKAIVVGAILNFNLSKNIYSLGTGDFSHLLADEKAKISFFKAVEHFPKLMLNDIVFNASNYMGDEDRIVLLKKGLKNIDFNNVDQVKFLLSGENRILSSEKNILSHDFIDLLKKEDFSVIEKIILTKTTKDMVRSYLTVDGFIDLLKGAEVCTPTMESDIRAKFKLVPGDGYCSVDEKFQCEYVLSNGCLFPELLNKDFIKDNSVEFANIALNYDFSFNYGLVSSFYANGQYVDVTESIEDIIASDIVASSSNKGLLDGIISFAEKKLNEDSLAPLYLTDDNFSNFMEIIITGEDIKSSKSSGEDFNKYKEFACSNLLAKAFIQDGLSDENKEKLLNAVKMSYISSNLFHDIALGSFGKKVLLDENVLNNATIYQNKKNIQNIFTNFNVDYLEDDTSDNDFKL